MLQDADAVIRKAASRKREAAKFESDFLEREAQLSRLEDDAKTLAEHRTKVAQEVTALGDELAKVESVKEMYYRRTRIEEEIEEADSDLEDLELDLKARLAACWWAPLAATIEDRLGKADEALASAIETSKTRSSLTAELAHLRERPKPDICPTCRQPMDSHVAEHVNQREAEIVEALDALPAEVEDLGELHGKA